jgi:excisionase family DNA binding protein
MAKGQLPENLLTLQQVSELLNVHPNTLRRWCNQGKIPVLRLSVRGDRRFKREDIQLYLDRLSNDFPGNVRP